MITISKWFSVLVLLAGSLAAHAQLTSVDNGLAATDSNGLIWANTVGIDMGWSPYGGAGTVQGWVAGLNASNYGGHNDWILATGDGSQNPGVGNKTTNQLGLLFYTDCGNSPDTVNVLNNPGKDCTALSVLNNAINANPNTTDGILIFSSSLYGIACCNVYTTLWWAFVTPDGSQQGWNYDTAFGNGWTGTGDALAVRAGTFTTLYNFIGTRGSLPEAPLIQTTNGSLYGTTVTGGANSGGQSGYNAGTVFKITPTGTLSTLHTFCSQGNCADGEYPSAGLIQATDGNLYGTTSLGGAYAQVYNGGTVFKITPSGTLTTLYSFCSQEECPDGNLPLTALIQANDGNFYGTTSSGGANGYTYNSSGTVFRITPTGTLTTLYSFCTQTNCPDGGLPSGLIQATDGNFYGTTQYGGTYNYGTVFKITPTGTLSTLYSFCTQTNCTDGSDPVVGLIQATDGNLYGTTYDGGANSAGTIFKITPTGTLTTLYSLCSQTGCTDGDSPAAALIQATDGNLYGTTVYGGADGAGTVFKITLTGVLTTVHNFSGTDGELPSTGLTQATNGYFFGTTKEGATNSDGTVFNFDVGLGPFVALQTAFGRVGAPVKILGTDLFGATSVAFNGTTATFKVVSASEITTKVPTGATTGTVQVVTPGGTLNSNVGYTVESKTATPTFSPKAGTYTGAQTVKIKDVTAGATIYYTTDGTPPTTSSTALGYTSSIVVSNTATLKAVALGPDDELSAMGTAEYTIN